MRAGFEGAIATLPKRLLGMVLLGLVYFAAGKLGLALASLHPSASPVWPPSGLALAALLLWGPSLWPAIFAGAFLANLTTSGVVACSLEIAAGNSLEAVVTAWLLGRLWGASARFETPVQVAQFAVLALAPGTMISATLGVMSLVHCGLAEASAAPGIWITWWLGDVAGMLLITPLMVLWARSGLPQAGEWRGLLTLLAVTVIAGILAFIPLQPLAPARGPMAFLMIAPMLWAALRFRPRDTATVAFVLCCFAIIGTAADGGPFARQSLNESFLLVLSFILCATVPNLILSTEVGVTRRSEERERAAHAEVDRKVQQRTGELADANRTLRDEIEHRRRVELEEQMQRRQLDGAQRLANLGSWSWDVRTDKVTWSDQLYRIYDIGRADFDGTFEDLLSRIHPDDREGIRAEVTAAFASGGGFRLEERIVRPSGEIRILQTSGETIMDESGKPVQMIGVCQDVTERRRGERALEEARDQLAQSQKMEALGQLTGGMAHDFNNVLAAVMANLGLLRKHTADAPASARLVENALSALQRASTLTQRMLAFARRQDLKPERVDVAHLVQGMIDLLKRTLGPQIDIATSFPPEAAAAMVDSNQLELAIMNLALNARDAMPGGGRLTLSVETRRIAAPAPSATQPSPAIYVVIGVTDTGMGMDAGTLARATEPFFTTKEVGKGTGLGLSMAQGLAEQSGGRLVLSSQAGAGTTVQIWLPAAPADAAAARVVKPDETQHQPATKSLRVLAVDDDPLVLMGTVGMLEELGHTVLQAGRGSAALAVLRKDPSIDLLVTDQAMPGMTGSELVTAARALRPGLRAILTTGYAELGDAPRELPVLRKPYLPAALCKAIAEVMTARTQA